MNGWRATSFPAWPFKTHTADGWGRVYVVVEAPQKLPADGLWSLRVRPYSATGDPQGSPPELCLGGER